MPQWADLQGDFAAALLGPAAAPPYGLIGPDGEPCAKRFSVYRNNVVIGLIEAVEANFPATRRIVGEEFFRAMARAYVMAAPPNSPILSGYGAGFPQFVAEFEPARSLLYLADVAMIERAWIEAYHACEATPLTSEAFTALPPEQAPGLYLALHPSLRVARSQFPAVTIWRMNAADCVPEPVDLEAGGEDALVVRPEAEVEVRSMPPGGAEFVDALAQGLALAEATEAALQSDRRFDLEANLAALIAAGAFVGYRRADDTDETIIGERNR